MRYVSLFSGIEAATVAWEPLGWEPMAFCEIEPFPCAVLEERFPEVPNLGDVSKVDWGGFVETNGRPDVLVGGSPCQSFSVAGKREGLEGASGLMWEYVRAVAECRPRWVVWENVPGALSSTHGEDFRCLLDSLDELGYRVAWRVLDAQFFGVAQRRRRVFLVGDLGAAGGGAVEVLFEPESLCGDTRSSREKRKALAANAGVRASVDSGCLTPWDVQSKRIFSTDGAAPSLQSGTNEGMNIQPCVFQIAGNVIGRADGNGGNQLGVRNPDEGGAFTLTAADQHAVAFAANQRGEARLFGGDGQTVGAIPASQSGKQVTALAFKFHAGSKAGSAAVNEEVSPTLTADWHNPAVMTSSGQDVIGALCARDFKGVGNEYVAEGKVLSDGYAVRRLTPTECERLQGFPDGWTLIPYRGKPADECPDGPRYKAIGNSMAVPVMRWIGGRIEAVDSRK